MNLPTHLHFRWWVRLIHSLLGGWWHEKVLAVKLWVFHALIQEILCVWASLALYPLSWVKLGGYPTLAVVMHVLTLFPYSSVRLKSHVILQSVDLWPDPVSFLTESWTLHGLVLGRGEVLIEFIHEIQGVLLNLGRIVKLPRGWKVC